MYLIGNNQNSVLVVLSKKDVCLLGVVLVYRDKIKIIKIGVWLTASTLADKKNHLIDHRERHGGVRIRSDRRGLVLFLLRLPAVSRFLRLLAEFFLRRGPVLKKTETEKRYATRLNNGVLFMTEEREVFDVSRHGSPSPPPPSPLPSILSPSR